MSVIEPLIEVGEAVWIDCDPNMFTEGDEVEGEVEFPNGEVAYNANGVTYEMMAHHGVSAIVVGFDTGGYRLDVLPDYGWPSPLIVPAAQPEAKVKEYDEELYV